MRLSLRLIAFLVVGITLVTFVVARNQVRSEKRGLRTDLGRRAEILAESLQEIIEPALESGSRDQLRRIVERFGNRERLAGVVVYDAHGGVLAESSNLIARFDPPHVPLDQVKARDEGIGQLLELGGKDMHVYYLPLHRKGSVAGVLAIFHDASYIEAQSARIWRDTLWHVIAQVLLIVFITVLIVRWTIIGPISRTAEWMKQVRVGKMLPRPDLPKEGFLTPFSEEVVNLAQSLAEARAAAEEEARLRESGQSMWTPERLRISMQSKTLLSPLVVVSNREPYMHEHRGKGIEALVPASGLVTALEPILRACDGTWIASGSGDADRETVDEHDRLRVPPDKPEYTLRRVWLTKEEEEGYYYGFSNEGLWPLCHIAFTRPIFRASDWKSYQDANRKFAEAVLQEIEGAEHPLVLVQDYHFALLPRMIKEARPDARVAIFWHIPWPNPEAFGICPWQREVLDGLLGADLVGFHIQAHCNNFLETVNRALESRIEWERFAVKRHGQTTMVRPFPISVDFRENLAEAGASGSPYVLRTSILKNHGIEASFMGVGVDRIDYTKGILERFRGIERFLERWPSYQGQFTFAQIGAPSRTHIPRYRDFVAEVEAEGARINARFQTPRWKPIILLNRHHEHSEILPYYQAADLCMVTSLHDGMNLVAKEFVAAREDEEGALILSRFTGASRELRDAIVVNPYDIEQLSDAIRMALEMDAGERHTRMQRMRRTVREHNVYRWAGNLITDLSEIRIDDAEAKDSSQHEVRESNTTASGLAIVARKAGSGGGD
ncbi:MAG: trehalose-6-phosphate synthase [Candidatus Acidiferrales bacterium]